LLSLDSEGETLRVVPASQGSSVANRERDTPINWLSTEPIEINGSFTSSLIVGEAID